MTQPINNNVNLQPGSAEPLEKIAQTANHLKAKAAAKQFEALFASMMLHSMRKSVLQLGDNSLIPNSTGEKIFTDMLDDQYGNIMASNGSLGLAKIILQQIDNDKTPESSLDALSHLKGTAPWMTDKEFIPSGAGSIPPESPASIGQWQPMIDEAGKKFGVDKDLISAVISQESGGNQYAVSPRGAKGLMQLMDSTAQTMGVSSVFQPRQNIFGGTKYLKQLLDKYNGNEALALASYNAGSAAVDKYNGIPPYQETRRYVGNVLSLKKTIAAGNSTK